MIALREGVSALLAHNDSPAAVLTMMHTADRQREAQRWLTPGQRRLLAACAATVGVVAAYKVYRSERLKATHRALYTAADTFARYSDAASSVGQVAAVVAKDIKSFLDGDSDEVPRSLRQLAKLARCSDVQDTLAACVASSIKGVLSSSGEAGGPTIVDKVIDAVLSDRGQTLVGLAVRTAAHQSTETFCTAVRQGLEVALRASTSADQQQQQQQASVPPSPAGAFYSAASTPLGSPQQPRQHMHHYHHHVQSLTAAFAAGSNLHPAIGSVLAVLNSPQLLQAVDGLVSTCVGSTVGAYIAQAGSTENMLSTVLHTLAQPSNKQLVIDIMSQVSAVCCREMAAACVAPAAAVASRPSSRLSDVPGFMEQQVEQQQLLLQRQLSNSPIQVAAGAAAAGPSSRGGSGSVSPFKQPGQQQDAAALHHSISEGGFSHDSDAAGAPGSEPSSPQSGPSTPEPSVAAAEAAGSSQQQLRPGSYGSFAGSAVAGLILRRQGFGGLLSGGAGAAGSGAGHSRAGHMQAAAGAGGPFLVDPASLGPMSTAVTLFVQAARFQEFRSLVVDVTRGSTREFVQTLLPSGWVAAVSGGSSRRGRGGTSGATNSQSLAVMAALHRVYTAISVLILLMVYALSPKTLMLEGSS